MIARIFLWSWLITLPITVVGGYWFFATTERFYTFAVRYTGTEANPGGEMELTAIGQYELKILWQRLRAELNRLVLDESTLKPLRLYVPKTKIKQLESHMPQSGYENVRGAMFVDGKLIKVKYRYRGDSVYRWAWYKKSLRVKTNKKNLYGRMRTFNLLAARSNEQLNNYLSYQLADMMGLVAPRTELARVYLNGKDQGVHFQVEQVDEVFLRSRGLMPGDVYRGEIIGKDEFVGGDIESLFDTVAGWDKVTINNHYDEKSLAPLKRLIELLQSPDDQVTQESLSKLLDMEAWGAYSAFEALTQSKHADEVHNWRLFYDPWRQKFVPIVWDTMGWYDTVRSKKIRPVHIANSLMGALFRNGDFISARHRALSKFFIEETDQRFLELLDNTISTMEIENKTDPYLRPPSPYKVELAMQELRTQIHATFGLLDSRNLKNDKPIKYSFDESALTVKINSRFPVDYLALTFDRPVGSEQKVLVKTIGPGRESFDITGHSSITGNNVTIETTLLPNYIVESMQSTNGKSGWSSFQAQPIVIKIKFPELESMANIVELKAMSSKRALRVERVEKIATKGYDTLYRPIAEKPAPSIVRWSGEINITENIEINEELHIDAGTTVRLAPGASVVVFGKVSAEGSAESPIRFLPIADVGLPWGTFSIQGRGADGSRFSHCEFSGGSGIKAELYEYSALFSVHDVRDVKVSDCKFLDNAIVDDMVHTVYSDIVFERVEFANAVSDALDLDNSVVTIRDSLFRNSGNDGIDLMTTTATVINTQIINNGDKGISVGEASELIAINNLINDNKVGVQSKDRSVALLFNNTLRNNKMALHAYRKNWQYGTGGQIFASKSVIEGEKDGEDVLATSRSAIGLYDSYVSNKAIFSKRIDQLEVDNKSRNVAVRKTSAFEVEFITPEVSRVLHSLPENIKEKLMLDRRGANIDD